MKKHTFFRKLGKMSQTLSSAAVVIGVLYLNQYPDQERLFDGSFSASAPKLWNSPPSKIRPAHGTVKKRH